jgi:hypothetical protein
MFVRWAAVSGWTATYSLLGSEAGVHGNSSAAPNLGHVGKLSDLHSQRRVDGLQPGELTSELEGLRQNHSVLQRVGLPVATAKYNVLRP